MGHYGRNREKLCITQKIMCWRKGYGVLQIRVGHIVSWSRIQVIRSNCRDSWMVWHYTNSTQTNTAQRVISCSRMLCVNVRVKEIKNGSDKGNALNDRRKFWSSVPRIVECRCNSIASLFAIR